MSTGAFAFSTPLVGQYMTTPVHTVHETTRLVEVERLLEEHGISCLPVLGPDGRAIGVISRFDLLRMGRLRARTGRRESLLELPDQPASRAMHREVIAVEPRSSVQDVVIKMLDRKIHRVFVLDNGHLEGVVSTMDLMRAVMHARIEAPISKLMSSPVQCVEVTDSIDVATDRLTLAHVQGVVVLEESGPVGVFTQREALAARDLPVETPVEQAMSSSVLGMPVETPLFRAAGMAAAARARRVLAIERGQIRGILTGHDFVRALL